jgi:hypothetical protein
MEHFTNCDKPSWLSRIFAIVFFITWIPFVFFYEWFLEPRLWNNRWRLHWLLKSNKAKIYTNESQNFEGIVFYTMEIDGEKYDVSIWKGRAMTLSKEKTNYIGLFQGCLTTKWLNKKACSYIKEMSDLQMSRERKLRQLGIR